MTVNFTTEERQFLGNVLIGLPEDEVLKKYIGPIADSILPSIIRGIPEVYLDTVKIGYLQSILQELSEIHGSRRSVANEKSLSGPQFIPTQTLVLVKSISDKLGAALPVDIVSKSDGTPIRGEGSISIMINPKLIK